MDSDTTETRSNINLHLGDSLEAMRSMPDNAYDLAIVDPPYGIDAANMNLGKGGGVAKHNNHKKKNWDKLTPTVEYFEELQRVSKNQIIWGGNYYDLPKTKGWIIWKKMDIKNDFNPLEMAWTSNLKMGFFDFLWCGMWQENMKDKEKRIHPTQKPVKLYEWLLTNYAKEGDKILDTHGGSCSIALACHNLKFDLDLWELDEDYHAAGVKRFEQHKKQLQLF
jgi:site-specific DNA-methyltransferase (adenine-specific)